MLKKNLRFYPLLEQPRLYDSRYYLTSFYYKTFLLYNFTVLFINSSQYISKVSPQFRALFNSIAQESLQTSGMRVKFRLVGSGYFFQELSNTSVAVHAGMSHVYVITFVPELTWVILGRKKKILACAATSPILLAKLFTQLRQLRLPDAYKGKGLRLLKETVKLRKGKKKFV